MRSIPSLVSCLAILGLSAFTSAQDEQTATGKVVVATNLFKMQAGEMYEVFAEGKNFRPSVNASYSDAFTTYPSQTGFDPSKQYIQHLYLVPKRTGDIPLHVGYPGFPSGAEETFDYKIQVKRLPFAKTPLFEKKDSLTADDPVYSDRPSPHKAYPITLKSGKFYIIDMVRKKTIGLAFGGFDPYLYLEDAKPAKANQKVVAQDDDGGGDLNARIIYQATKNGEFRIIATSLNKTPGEFTVTVREQE